MHSEDWADPRSEGEVLEPGSELSRGLRILADGLCSGEKDQQTPRASRCQTTEHRDLRGLPRIVLVRWGRPTSVGLHPLFRNTALEGSVPKGDPLACSVS